MAGTRKGRGRGGRVRAVYGRVKTKGENTFGGRLGRARERERRNRNKDRGKEERRGSGRRAIETAEGQRKMK